MISFLGPDIVQKLLQINPNYERNAPLMTEDFETRRVWTYSFIGMYLQTYQIEGSHYRTLRTASWNDHFQYQSGTNLQHFLRFDKQNMLYNSALVNVYFVTNFVIQHWLFCR